MDGFEKVNLGKINDGNDFLKREMTMSDMIRQNFIKESNKQNRENEKLLEEAWEDREKVSQAQIETANNTDEMKRALETIINNQDGMIKMLEGQLKDINLTLDLIFNSLYDIKEISGDALTIYNSIHTQMMQGRKPDIKALLLDKSGDIIIQVFFLLVNGALRLGIS
jgi:hypothetical protein